MTHRITHLTTLHPARIECSCGWSTTNPDPTTARVEYGRHAWPTNYEKDTP